MGILIMRQLLLCLVVAMGLMNRAASAAEYTAQPGPFIVGTLEQTWHDAGRNRDVPVKFYYPKVDGKKRNRGIPRSSFFAAFAWEARARVTVISANIGQVADIFQCMCAAPRQR